VAVLVAAFGLAGFVSLVHLGAADLSRRHALRGRRSAISTRVGRPAAGMRSNHTANRERRGHHEREQEVC